MDQQKAQGGEGGTSARNDDTANELEAEQLRYRNLTDRFELISDPSGAGAEEAEAINEELEKVRENIIALGGDDPAAADVGSEVGKSGDDSVPPEAQTGDEVRIGAEVYRVGHGGKLTSGPVEADGKIIHPRHQWQRELGTGGKGAWQIVHTYPEEKAGGAPSATVFSSSAGATATTTNTPSAVSVVREHLEPEVERLTENIWKIGTGALDKIGLPDYSSFQIGPVSASRMVIVDDDDLIEVTLGKGDTQRKKKVPRAVVEKFEMLGDTVEYVMGMQRSQFVAFLEAVKPGSTQPQ